MRIPIRIPVRIPGSRRLRRRPPRCALPPPDVSTPFHAVPSAAVMAAGLNGCLAVQLTIILGDDQFPARVRID
ncbi:MAG: hypothetical protein VX106_03770 [Pseudomonadota bacterium]|nr:hypothetical protein [Pseudomonadota bacterium]